jgi:uncharacterized protein YcbK (DUF882 family)
MQSRRGFIRLGGAGVLTLLAQPALALVPTAPRRNLSFLNLHTDERAQVVYWADGRYQREGLRRIDRILRDHRTGDVMEMDRRLLDLLFVLQRKLGSMSPYHVISGYRSPQSNAMLAAHSGGVAKRSLHMQGMAIDIRLPGCKLLDVRLVALALGGGGVGYYPKSDFVHLDVGRVRHW